MNLKEFLIAIAVSTFFSLIGWLIVLTRVDPETSGWPGIILFYLTAFASLVGLFSLAGTWLRAKKETHPHLIIREVKIAVRHAIFIASMGLGALALASHNLLRWWVWILFLCIICVLEYIFLLIQDHRRT